MTTTDGTLLKYGKYVAFKIDRELFFLKVMSSCSEMQTFSYQDVSGGDGTGYIGTGMRWPYEFDIYDSFDEMHEDLLEYFV